MLNNDYCRYCKKEFTCSDLVYLDFYFIGRIACKDCATKRIKEIQEEIIPNIKEDYNLQ